MRVYEVTRHLPADERFELSRQLRNAAVSIPSNIAEGCGRDSDADFERFLSIAAGSTSEVDDQLSLVQRLWPAIDGIGDLRGETQRVRRMLWGLIRASKRGNPKSDVGGPKSSG